MIAERISSHVQRAVLARARQEIFVSASIGIALSGSSAEDAEDLIRDADSAMYRAKDRGRGQYEVFDELMHAQMLGRLRTREGPARGAASATS